VLGPRLRECTRLVTLIEGQPIDAIVGWPDNMKVQSSMTLFVHAADDNDEFLALLAKYYDGEQDATTVQLLSHGLQD
jgi:uncharacterized protein (DUF1810 family)